MRSFRSIALALMIGSLPAAAAGGGEPDLSDFPPFQILTGWRESYRLENLWRRGFRAFWYPGVFLPHLVIIALVGAALYLWEPPKPKPPPAPAQCCVPAGQAGR